MERSSTKCPVRSSQGQKIGHFELTRALISDNSTQDEDDPTYKQVKMVLDSEVDTRESNIIMVKQLTTRKEKMRSFTSVLDEL